MTYLVWANLATTIHVALPTTAKNTATICDVLVR